jgi:parallel beta-helix repeat protein
MAKQLHIPQRTLQGPSGHQRALLHAPGMNQRECSPIARPQSHFPAPPQRLVNQLLASAVLFLLCCLPSAAATFRWSASENTIFVENGGSATLTGIKTALPGAPLDMVDPTNKTWLVRANLLITDGTSLVLHGSGSGGDVNELRLQSVNSAGSGCGCVIALKADWGTLDISGTKITSWDTAVGGPDLDPTVNGRAYIEVRSALSTNGVTPLESRMNIINSEICFLGSRNGGAYGLVWKVDGSTATNLPPNSPGSVFDRVNVFGTIVNSRIHDNYRGIYAYGAQGMQWLDNEVYNNTDSGLNLDESSSSLLIQGNSIHHNGTYGIVAVKRCDRLAILGNTCSSNADSGILLQRNSNDSLVEGNLCLNNGDSGIGLTAIFRTTVRSNLLAGNAYAGLRVDLGSADNLIINNESASNTLYGFHFQQGSGVPEPNDDGRPKRNLILANLNHHNGLTGLEMDDSDDNTFATNTFYANGPLNSRMRFQRSSGNVLDGNSIPSDVFIRTESDSETAAITVLMHQPFISVQLSTNASEVFRDAQGRIYQPDESAVATVVSTNGSSLTLTPDGIGTTTKVIARDFWVTALPGTALIHHLVWTDSPLGTKQWSTAAGFIGQNLGFTIGGLATNASYSIHKADTLLTNLVSDALGRLSFSDIASTESVVVYSVGVLDLSLPTFRWSASLNRISVQNGNWATLSDIKAALPTAPLDLVDPTNKIWLLRADLVLNDGSGLRLHGDAAGGDVNELRLLSDNTGITNTVVSITADWGTLHINSTKVTSWDTAASSPDTDPASFGRAFIRARSRLSTNNVTSLESRMDIRNSEVSFLGYNASEAYGLVWKVVGSSSVSNIFSQVNVLGTVANSHIHDNYIGAYSLGASGMQWLTNEVDHNAQYGIDLQDHSRLALLQGNNLHHNGNHGLFASINCNALTIRGNRSSGNFQSGILLDRESNGSQIESNECSDNGSSGIAISAGFSNLVTGNLLLRNQQAGLRLSLGSADNSIQSNETASNILYGLNLQIGSGVPLPNDDGHPKRNLFASNFIHDNISEPIRLSDSDDNIFATNTFNANGTKLRFQRGLRNVLDGNNIPAGLAARTEGDANSSALTNIRNQSSLLVELGTSGSVMFLDDHGRIYQPDEANVLTEISTLGSTLTLTTSNIGSSSTIVGRNLWSSASPGSAAINRLVWTNANSKQWTVTAGSIRQVLNFTVGDLQPNSAYEVLRAGSILAGLNSDSSGQLHFSDISATASAVVYSVNLMSSNAAPLILPLRITTGSTLNLSWFAPLSGSVLQRTPTLSPPNWVDVATNFSAASWGSYLANPASNSSSFFRLKQAPP